MINCTFTQFINATKQAIQRYRAGEANADDMAQIGYAAQHGMQHLANSGMQSYPRVHAEYEQLMSAAVVICEDEYTE